jgi:hypothetical protein
MQRSVKKTCELPIDAFVEAFRPGATQSANGCLPLLPSILVVTTVCPESTQVAKQEPLNSELTRSGGSTNGFHNATFLAINLVQGEEVTV